MEDNFDLVKLTQHINNNSNDLRKEYTESLRHMSKELKHEIKIGEDRTLAHITALENRVVDRANKTDQKIDQLVDALNTNNKKSAHETPVTIETKTKVELWERLIWLLIASFIGFISAWFASFFQGT